MADIVFADDDALKRLNAIVHPAVGAAMAERLAELAETDHVVVLDIPLLVESGRDDMAATIVVDVDPDIAVARLVEHRGFCRGRRPGPDGPTGEPRGSAGARRRRRRQLRFARPPADPGRRPVAPGVRW